ncbi:MAG: helix-turn-helix domain-containing protein [Verrucomicrobiota bacterium]
MSRFGRICGFMCVGKNSSLEAVPPAGPGGSDGGIHGHRVPAQEERRIGVIVFDQVALQDIAGPIDVLKIANSAVLGAHPCYDVGFYGVTANTFACDSGLNTIAVCAKFDLKDLQGLDTVIIPGGSGMLRPEVRNEVAAWLQKHSAYLRRIVCIGTGIYALAESGIAAGRRLTSHWRLAPRLRERYPTLRIELAASSLRDGPVYTCSSSRAATDLALSLVEEDLGRHIALAVCRELVVPLRALNHNEPALLEDIFAVHYSERLAELPSWIASNLREELTVESLARRTCLCPRHFARMFKAAFHVTPARLVESLRFAEAHKLLATNLTIEQVADAIGFNSADAFSRAFSKRYKMPPTSSRRGTDERTIFSHSPSIQWSSKRTRSAGASDRHQKDETFRKRSRRSQIQSRAA